MTQHLRAAILGVILLTLLTGCVFPLALFGLGQCFSTTVRKGVW
jgi:K+-transporting ATPase c subunit